MLKGRFNLRRLVALGLASKRKLTTLTTCPPTSSTCFYQALLKYFCFFCTSKHVWMKNKNKTQMSLSRRKQTGSFSSKRSQNQTAVQRTKSTWSKLSGTRAIAVTDAVWRWVCARLHKSALTWLPLNKHTATWECGVQIVFLGGRVCLSPNALLAKVC